MASKRGPLSKAETFYVTEHAKTGKSVQDIALDLDRPIKAIEKCFTKAQKDSEATLNAGSQFARHKGSVVMTQNASTLGDLSRKRQPQTKQSCVTKIKKED
jgi:hypothetical protein